MHKKLLTLAVAGALAGPGMALAQSSVEVYGFISMAPNHFKFTEGTTGPNGTGAAVGSVSKWDVSSHGTNFGFRGREALGGGLTAWFQIETNAPFERSNNIAITPASRNSAVGLQSSWGNVYWGQWTTPWADLDGMWAVGHVGGYSPVLSVIGRRETTGTAPHLNCANALSGGVNAPGVLSCDPLKAIGGVGHPFWRRASQAIVYNSPKFSGMQFNVLYQTNEGKQPGVAGVTSPQENAQMWSTSLTWSGMGGRARVGGAIDRHKDFTTVGDTDTGWKLAGGWNFGVVDVGATVEQMTYKCQGATAFNQQNAGWNGQSGSCAALGATGDVKNKAYGIAASIPVGLGAIKASYAKVSDLNGTPLVTDTGARYYTIGYVHRLSKRTELGTSWAKIKNGTGATMTWTGSPPDTNGTTGGVGTLNPVFGSSPSVLQVNLTHRF